MGHCLGASCESIKESPFLVTVPTNIWTQESTTFLNTTCLPAQRSHSPLLGPGNPSLLLPLLQVLHMLLQDAAKLPSGPSKVVKDSLDAEPGPGGAISQRSGNHPSLTFPSFFGQAYPPWWLLSGRVSVLSYPCWWYCTLRRKLGVNFPA